MAFFYRNAGAFASNASAVTLTPANPTGPSSPNGSIRIAVCAIKSNAVISTATPGWTKVSQDNSGASFTVAVFVGTAAAANPVFTWAGAVACGAISLLVEDFSNPVVNNAIGNSATGTGTVALKSVASYNTSRYGSLALYVIAVAANSSAIATPTGFTEFVEAGTTGSVNIRMSIGGKGMLASGSAVGAASASGPAAAWVMKGIELLIALPATGIQTPLAELSSVITPPTGLATSLVEIVTILNVGSAVVSRPGNITVLW
jgi:hypothetical protein